MFECLARAKLKAQDKLLQPTKPCLHTVKTHRSAACCAKAAAFDSLSKNFSLLLARLFSALKVPSPFKLFLCLPVTKRAQYPAAGVFCLCYGAPTADANSRYRPRGSRTTLRMAAKAAQLGPIAAFGDLRPLFAALCRNGGENGEALDAIRRHSP